MVPSIASDSDGNLHLVWMEAPGNYYTKADIFYSTMTPAGNWSDPINISNTSYLSGSPQIAVDPSDNLHVIWFERIPDSSVIYYTFRISGKWSKPISISDRWGGAQPRMGIDSEGNVHVIWWPAVGPVPMMYRKKTNAGWEPIEERSNYIINHKIAVSPDGDVHIATEGGNIQNDIYYLMRYSAGIWSTPINLSKNKTYSWVPAIALDNDDNVYVSWTEKETNQIHFKARSMAGVKIDSIPQIEGDPWRSKIVVDENKNIYFLWSAWTSEFDYDVYLIKRDFNGNWSDLENISQTKGASLINSVVLDNQGILHVVWQDKTPGNWEIYYK
ncbi:MAG: hypothetical protein ACE5J3_14085, partial [Methanosarcinales archaeon]